ncbi:MAG: TonB-dependent receptor [Opitutaceae bacterium]
MNTSILRASRRVRLPLGLLFGALVASPMMAQQTGSAGETVKLEEFVVTGSHIPTTETAYDARTAPVDIMTRKDFDELGYGTVEQVIQSMPYVQASVPVQNNQTGFTAAASSVNLRGLGSDATLVLLNGRRVAPYPRGTGGTTAFIDIQSFPLAAIDQVEVLLDGASATYGADAVAGVVNIKTRRDFNGAELSVRYGNSTAQDDAMELMASGVYGLSTEDTKITVGLNYFKQNDMRHSDREYSAVPPFLSSNASPLNFQISRAAALEALGEGGESLIPSSDLFFTSTWTNRESNNGTLPASSYDYASGRPSTYNFNLQAQSTPHLERKGGYASFEKKLFGTDNISTYGDLIFQQNFAQNELAPSATGNFGNPGGVSLVIPARTANAILQVQDLETKVVSQIAAGSPIPEGSVPFYTTQNVNGNAERITTDRAAYNPFNPFNEDFSGGSRARLAEFGNRIYRTTNTAMNFVWGVKGEKLFGNWNADLNTYYSKVQQVERDTLVSISRFNRLVNANDSFFDPTSGDYLGTTVPYNPFGYFANPIPNNSKVAPAGTVELHNVRESEMYGVNVTVSNGSLFDLPGGSAGIALGYEVREETMMQSPDVAGTSGDVIGSSTDNTTNANRSISAFFAELGLPILSPDNDVAGFHSLSLNLSARYEKFWTQDDDVAVPKVALKWQPFDDSFVVRGSWGQGYRQPSMYELYAAGLTSALTAINDPVKQINEPEMDITTASSSLLRAEDSENYSIGFVWTPSFASTDTSGLSFGVDYWNVKRNGNVAVDHQDVVDRAFKGETLIPGESIVRDFQDNLVQVNAVFRNVGNENAEGIDIQASYFWVMDSAGRFDIGLNASYLQKYEIQQFPAAPFFDYVGEMTDISFDNETGDPSPGAGDAAYVDWRGVGFLRWSKSAMNASLQANYTAGFRDFKSEWDPSAPNDPAGFTQVDSMLTFDVSFTYNFFEDSDSWWGNTAVTLNVQNILDKDPPRVVSWDNNSTGYPGFMYSPKGRFVSLQVTKKL